MQSLNKELFSLLKRLYDISKETFGHSIRVAYLCVNFGYYLELSEKDIGVLKMAGLFHDIGKLSIPIEIISKPTKLTKEEYEIIKKHPLHGVELLKQAGISEINILEHVLNHHERLDGLGYPFGKDKNSINYLTRILTICDCYDAMNSNRAYHDKKDFNYICLELLRMSNQQFDSELVEKFLCFISKKNSVLAGNKFYN